jgi:urease accessory protein
MPLQFLHLFHLVSPALPVGAYAYSQGLEYAVDAKWLASENDLCAWLTGIMENGFAQLDAPVMLRCLNAWQNEDVQKVKYWNEYLLACRETSELLLEDTQIGLALHRLLKSLNIPQAHEAWEQMSFASQFALACHHWQIEANLALQGFFWTWLENQVAAATKLIPLGQTQAQKILVELMAKIPALVEQTMTLCDDEMGWSLPGVVLASSKHERQYSRLFRS